MARREEGGGSGLRGARGAKARAAGAPSEATRTTERDQRDSMLGREDRRGRLCLRGQGSNERLVPQAHLIGLADLVA